MKVTRVLAK